jgi:hypothetical protein
MNYLLVTCSQINKHNGPFMDRYWTVEGPCTLELDAITTILQKIVFILAYIKKK